jgi:hypothetical protein
MGKLHSDYGMGVVWKETVRPGGQRPVWLRTMPRYIMYNKKVFIACFKAIPGLKHNAMKTY